MILQAKNVTKRIKNKVILNSINMELTSGKIYGVVGQNGSGKTMLFRALSGLINIDEGEISVDGKILHKDMKILPNLGLILENAGLYPELSGFKNLELLAKINKKASKDDIAEAIKRVGLDPEDKRAIKKYSLGMKQKIVLAQAIMEKPDIIMLDEPTNALDEKSVEQTRQIILEEKSRGAMILIASHNNKDIELLADEVFNMNEGSILRKEEASEN